MAKRPVQPEWDRVERDAWSLPIAQGVGTALVFLIGGVALMAEGKLWEVPVVSGRSARRSSATVMEAQVERSTRLIAHDPGIVSRRNQVDISGSGFSLRAILHPEAHPPGDEIAEVPLRAQLTFDDALLVLRPAPARLKGCSVERYAAELDEIDASQGHDPARVRSIEAMDLWLLVHRE